MATSMKANLIIIEQTEKAHYTKEMAQSMLGNDVMAISMVKEKKFGQMDPNILAVT